MAQQYIFQMQGLTKTFPGGKKIFENIWLSFYNDAKIGVVGVNGSGKSTLLKIMAGLDKEFQGEAKAADGVKRGYLEQEPPPPAPPPAPPPPHRGLKWWEWVDVCFVNFQNSKKRHCNRVMATHLLRDDIYHGGIGRRHAAH